MNLTDRFLENIYRIRRMIYSEDVEKLVRTYLADTVGVTLAGDQRLKCSFLGIG